MAVGVANRTAMSDTSAEAAPGWRGGGGGGSSSSSSRGMGAVQAVAAAPDIKVKALQTGAQPPAPDSTVNTRIAKKWAGGEQLAHLLQVAWPSWRHPRVGDALLAVSAGIAVLDPAPPPPPGTSEGCFSLFNRGVATVPLQGQVTLLRVLVADGAVELVLLRPRRGAAGGGRAAVAAPAQQRVRVAALSGVHPVLGSAGSAAAGGAGDGAGLDDDVADPASRWVQLVAMDGGLMRLSACSPADHARLVLGLNAGLLVAMGVISEDAPLATVPLCRALGGVPN
jgi:hypothetical protein